MRNRITSFAVKPNEQFDTIKIECIVVSVKVGSLKSTEFLCCSKSQEIAMLDMRFIRENQEMVAKAIASKAVNLSLDELIEKDNIRRDLINQVESYRRERNINNELLKSSEVKTVDRDGVIKRGKELKMLISEAETHLQEVESEFVHLMAKVPNFTSPDTPEGCGDEDNIETYRSVSIREFDFAPKDHIQIGNALGIIDLERGAKVAGYRGYYICDKGVSLMLGFMMYALNKMILKGYSPMLVPTIVKEFALFGSGYFKGIEYDSSVDEIFQVTSLDVTGESKPSKEKKFLVGTSEPSLLAYFANDVLKESDLPIKLSGFSQCYRSEIGSHGRDTKGLYRVHEFMKVEQIVLMRADIDESVKMQDEMVQISREMHEELGIPYRLLQICSQDMGLGKYRMFDIEAWMPGLNRWGETGSASNFLDWQARRLNVRYETHSGKKKNVFMLNNTALPSPRIFIALLENHQQKDGSVLVPEVIKPFMPVRFDVMERRT